MCICTKSSLTGYHLKTEANGMCPEEKSSIEMQLLQQQKIVTDADIAEKAVSKLAAVARMLCS